MQRIVIIGGGLSSRLLTIQLLRLAGEQVMKITIIEKHAPERLGDAFCTDKDYHLLNVVVAKMSAYADRPDDLQEWCIKKGYPFASDSFMPRKLYKEYIAATFEKEIGQKRKNVTLCFLQAEACDIDMENRTVISDSGAAIPADKIILAIGNFPPFTLSIGNRDYISNPGYYSSAWKSNMFSHLNTYDPVLIIGTGLTMTDVLLLLKEQGHKGNIFALSTHGFLPVVHKQSGSYPPFYHELEGCTEAISIFKSVRNHIRKAAGMNIDWRAVIDSLRPFTHKIWGNLPPIEKHKCMEHLRHLWGVARHRMPPENAAVVDSLLNKGYLRILAGRIFCIEEISARKFLVGYKERHSGILQHLEVNVIVNCMGPASNYKRLNQPLLKNLLKKELIQTDLMQLGINCLPDGAIIGKNGEASDFLYTIGPPAKGILWESTAVPEIRLQAQRLAISLTGSAKTQPADVHWR